LRASYIRVIFSEITRILNHLLAVTTHALDVGALTPFLWGFERGRSYGILRAGIWSKITFCLYKTGGCFPRIPIGLCDDIYRFVNQAFVRLDEIQSLLSQIVYG